MYQEKKSGRKTQTGNRQVLPACIGDCLEQGDMEPGVVTINRHWVGKISFTDVGFHLL